MKHSFHYDSPAWANAQPTVSVLIPFLRDDPTDLLQRLDTEARSLTGQAELIVLDDGTNDVALTARLSALLDGLALPARLITLDRNQGRSEGRNRLAQAARGSTFLFLDSDMRPDHAGFLTTWVTLARAVQPAVAFGGFSLLQAPRDACFAVHRHMAARSDCIQAAQRAEQPEKYVFTSNLMVRRDVFDTETFDADFSGWGWEDVEWAMRVSRRFDVVHVDNPATHMGLDTVEALAAKYEQSAPNFARVVARHPDFVTAYPSYRVAKALKTVPGMKLIRPLIKATARTRFLPTGMRALALRLYRASLYSEVI